MRSDCLRSNYWGQSHCTWPSPRRAPETPLSAEEAVFSPLCTLGPGPPTRPSLLLGKPHRIVCPPSSAPLLPPPGLLDYPFIPAGPSGHTTCVAPKQQLLTSVSLRDGQGNPGASTGACTASDSFSPPMLVGRLGCSVSPARSAGAAGPGASSGSSSAGVPRDTGACMR
ncbi:hypothetical protein NDU88_006645 [Pleurodeles waltl]|uniref:Uncharacterized protein n=1 Tax=Pleurodeles waltl TaxID=8319 RepID=A0AAV7RQQ8_PLEWA|nr:hypothetical protein NDU88_006645 [Pleurodeles waltl]